MKVSIWKVLVINVCDLKMRIRRTEKKYAYHFSISRRIQRMFWVANDIERAMR